MKFERSEAKAGFRRNPRHRRDALRPGPAM